MTTQDFSMFPNQLQMTDLPHIPTTWLAELGNATKQIIRGGLAQNQDIRGFSQSYGKVLHKEIMLLDLDVPDFPMDWMEEYVHLDKLLTLEDVSILDDVAFQNPTAQNNPVSHSNYKVNVEPNQEQKQISDTLQQLLQLQAMVDPKNVYTPPVSPQNVFDPVSSPTPPNRFNPPSFSQQNSNFSFTLESKYTPPISPKNLIPSTKMSDNFFTLSPFENEYKSITQENVFSQNIYHNSIFGNNIYPSAAPAQACANAMTPNFPNYSPPRDNFYLNSSSSSSSQCSSPLSSEFCYSPEPLNRISPQSTQVFQFEESLDDYSSCTPNQMSDSSLSSNNSFFDFVNAPVSSRKRRSATGNYPQNKRSRKANPKEQPELVIKMKKERKKDQNKTAATRYRVKKRSEAEVLSKEESELVDRNKELNGKVDKLATEIGYLKGLLKDILRVQGVLK